MSAPVVQETLHGWAAASKGARLEKLEMPLKKFTEDDVDIKVTHCGICGSDIHTLDSGWSPTDYPCVVGHEITGVVIRVGANVKHLKVGDNAGVGAQSGSCGKCEECLNGEENLCSVRWIGTYAGRWPDGTKTTGGYSDYWRGHSHFVFKVPDGMTNEIAATFFCAGVTTYVPLKRNNVGSKSVVAVMGMGGLGHYGVQWATALGAQVYVISRNDAKKADSMTMGATGFVDMSRPPGELEKFKKKFTHILYTSPGKNPDWDFLLGLLKANGKFIIVGIPESRLSGIRPNTLVMRQISITGSIIGSPATIREMLEFAQEKGVKPWINKFKMDQVNEAVEVQRKGDSRYRIVLEN